MSWGAIVNLWSRLALALWGQSVLSLSCETKLSPSYSFTPEKWNISQSICTSFRFPTHLLGLGFASEKFSKAWNQKWNIIHSSFITIYSSICRGDENFTFLCSGFCFICHIILGFMLVLYWASTTGQQWYFWNTHFSDSVTLVSLFL